MNDKWQKQIEGIIADHEERITKLENRKKSKMPKWFYDWNQTVFEPRISNLEKDMVQVKKDIANLNKEVFTLKKAVFKK